MKKRTLRNGFTTGSAAAAGTKAALLCLCKGQEPEVVDIPLPEGGRLAVPVAEIESLPQGVRAAVVKDGGDDPDVTHRAVIRSTVQLLPEKGCVVRITGGRGVGRVTRPGLPVPVGRAAINPAPYQQIQAAALEVMALANMDQNVSVTIEVVDGEKIAQKTLNPRLGITGGISILGTRGTVKPFSNRAYKDTITLSMDVAAAEGVSVIGLSTGGRSEGFLKHQRQDLPDVAFIQVADFFSFSIKQAARRGFGHILYACFFGKLTKTAQGAAYTHAKNSRIDFHRLSRWCASAGMGEGLVQHISAANTAREALEYIMEDAQAPDAIGLVLEKAFGAARKFAGAGPDLTCYLFDFKGGLIAQRHGKGGVSS